MTPRGSQGATGGGKGAAGQRQAGPTAVLAGLPGGIQSAGPWIGRRQLFVRFAAEAETATLFTAAALARELERLSGRSQYHSIAATGHDVLGNAVFLAAVLWTAKPQLPIMVDTDGQRPEAVAGLRSQIALLQVTLDLDAARPGGGGSDMDRAVETLSAAGGIGCEHALVLRVDGQATDAQILRLVEQAHRVSARVSIVVHPRVDDDRGLDGRWGRILEEAMRMHPDTRVLPVVPPQAGIR